MKELDPNYEPGEEAGEPLEAGGDVAAQSDSKTPALSTFGRDLTEMAASGELDPVIGRASEIERVIRYLPRTKILLAWRGCVAGIATRRTG